MTKRTEKARQIVQLCDDLLRVERGKLAKLIRHKDQLQHDRQRIAELIDGAQLMNSRLMEIGVSRLSWIDRQLHRLELQIDTQREMVNDAAVRGKAAEASLRSAREREELDKRRTYEIEMSESVAWDWSGKAPIS